MSMDATKPACLADALELCRKGYPLTICEEKRPIGKEWHKHPLTEVAILARFKNNPQLNVGLVLGEQPGIIDFECGSPQAEADLQELFGSAIPNTPCFQSQRGKHYLFRVAAPLEGQASSRIG